MRFLKVLALVFAALFVSIGAARATVQIHIDLSTQRMHVESSKGSYTWPVSTARSGYVTPRGSFAPTGLQKMHYSRKYHMSPMPHSIFFNGGYAIHGTYATGALGRPASHGCVRVAPGNAAALYKMVQDEGAQISITGNSPSSTRYARTAGRTAMSPGLHRPHRSHAIGLCAQSPRAMAYGPQRYRGSASVKTWQSGADELSVRLLTGRRFASVGGLGEFGEEPLLSGRRPPVDPPRRGDGRDRSVSRRASGRRAGSARRTRAPARRAGRLASATPRPATAARMSARLVDEDEPGVGIEATFAALLEPASPTRRRGQWSSVAVAR